MCPNELPKHFERNAEDISDTSIIANKFNTFFATIGPNLANALQALEDASIGDYMGEHNINSMFLTPVDETEIINIVKLAKPTIPKIVMTLVCMLYIMLLSQLLSLLLIFLIYHSLVEFSQIP